MKAATYSGLAFALGGGLIGFVYLLVERARQRLAFSRLVESEKRFRALVESSSDWVWEVNARGIYTYCSPRIRELLGYTPEEVIGKTPFDLMPPDEAARVRALFNELVASRQACCGLENTNLHKNGRLVTLETNAVPIFDFTGAWSISRHGSRYH
jgi:PAS domain S-box-containing protein